MLYRLRYRTVSAGGITSCRRAETKTAKKNNPKKSIVVEKK